MIQLLVRASVVPMRRWTAEMRLLVEGIITIWQLHILQLDYDVLVVVSFGGVEADGAWYWRNVL